MSNRPAFRPARARTLPQSPRLRSLAVLAIAALCSRQPVAADGITVIESVKSRNVETVIDILRRRVDVNARQADGATALHWAAHFGDVTIAELLIRAGARATVADDTGVTPVHLACTSRSAALVDLLLEAGADPNATLLNGETALMTCARTGEVDAVKALVARGADVNRREPFHDQTALMWAAAERHPGVVAALIDRGASVTARSRTYTQTVTSEVTQRAGREELNYTVPRGGTTPLLFAARSGDVESARLLIAGGARVDEALPDGMTALVLAAHSGHQPVGVLLLDQGADPDASEVGYTALHAATLRGGVDLVKALLAHGANPNLRITKGTPVRRNSEDFELSAALIGATPYLLAARFLETDIMRALAAGGADTQLSMPSGDTPLMAAAGLGASPQADRRGLSVLDGGRLEDEGRVVDAVAAAIADGADVNRANRSGDTAMHAAALLGYERVIQQLADAGARLDVKNARGQTALTQLTARTGGAPRALDRSSRGTPGSTIALLRKLGATE
jgi:ankyrin repeat protein